MTARQISVPGDDRAAENYGIKVGAAGRQFAAACEIANANQSLAATSKRTAAAMAEVAATTEHGNDRTISGR
jgi:hypothetical protein